MVGLSVHGRLALNMCTQDRLERLRSMEIEIYGYTDSLLGRIRGRWFAFSKIQPYQGCLR